MEAFRKAVLPRAARLDVCSQGADALEPVTQYCCHELRPVVAAYESQDLDQFLHASRWQKNGPFRGRFTGESGHLHRIAQTWLAH